MTPRGGSVAAMAPKATTYWDYIKVEELLALQGGVAETDADLSNDEVVFIVVHQIDELWFKLALREVERSRDLFAAEKVRDVYLEENASPETSGELSLAPGNAQAAVVTLDCLGNVHWLLDALAEYGSPRLPPACGSVPASVYRYPYGLGAHTFTRHWLAALPGGLGLELIATSISPTSCTPFGCRNRRKKVSRLPLCAPVSIRLA